MMLKFRNMVRAVVVALTMAGATMWAGAAAAYTYDDLTNAMAAVSDAQYHIHSHDLDYLIYEEMRAAAHMTMVGQQSLCGSGPNVTPDAWLYCFDQAESAYHDQIASINANEQTDIDDLNYWTIELARLQAIADEIAAALGS